MTTLAWLESTVSRVLCDEVAYSAALDEAGREERLRILAEIELTSRLRHALGGLDTLMSAQGPDISAPQADIQVKFPNYWHQKQRKPQPIAIKEIEKDLRWLLEPAPSRPRFFVVFLPQRELGFTVQRKGGNLPLGKRRFQHCFSARDGTLSGHPHASIVINTISKAVPHKTVKGATSHFRQWSDSSTYTLTSGDFVMRTVGSPASDLVWALIIGRFP